MDDELALATARIIMVEPPADQIQLPPPPPTPISAQTEQSWWIPQNAATTVSPENRVAINQEQNDPAAAAIVGLWLGGTALQLMTPDPVAEQEPPPRNDDESEEDDQI